MKTIVLTAVLITAFLAADLLPSAAQSAEQLYQRGLVKEEGEGALQDAIDLYNQVADNSSASTSLRAKSLLHIGMCFEKLGTQEAVKAYQRLVSSFPSQKSEVAIARERLAMLVPAEVKVSENIVIPGFTKIKMPLSTGNGVLSPDGKRMAFILDGCVWTVPVSGGVDPNIAGEPKKLTGNIGAWDMTNSFCWSGDGKWIAFNAWADLNKNLMSIYVVPSGGGEASEVEVPSHDGGWPSEYRLSLSPDGKTLAYATGYDPGDYQTRKTQIYTIPVNGGKAKELTEPGTWDQAWSPDGSRIAFVKFSRDNERNQYSELLVIPAQGGTPKVLIDKQLGQVMGPVWSPDGKMIAFIKRPEGENPKEIWLVQLTDEGDPVAMPRKVDLPLESFHAIAGWTPDNKIGLQLMNPQYETIYTVPADGGIATQVTPQGWTSYPRYSPDGKRIFFRWDGGKIASVPSEGGALDTIIIDSEFNIITAVPGSGNEISPDGKTIVFAGMKNFYDGEKKNWEVDIFTMPVEGGKPKQLTRISNKLQDRFPCWSPDGNSIAFIRPEIVDNEFYHHIYTISGNGENLKRITERSDEVAWAPIDWTPDGRSITFFTKNNTINSIPVQGGEPVLITEIDSANSQFDLAWSPDGKELAYTDKGKIWIYTPVSGTTREIKTGVTAHATKIGWSPDGKKIAFTAFAGGDTELWFMENFLPLEKLGPENVYSEPPLKPRFTKIKIPTRLSPAVVLSPDGKTLAHVADKKIWITPLTGNVGPGFPGKPFQLNTGDVEVEWTGLAWSCDGKWIAFNEDPAQRRRDGDTPHSEIIQGIYIVPSGGGVSRKILENSRDARVVNYRISLSPDGKTLAHTSVENKEQHIYLTTVDGGSSRRLVEMQAREPSFSPDGKMIAYVKDKDLGRGEGDLGLYVVPVTGGIPHLLAEAGKAASPVWSPDGSMLAFIDDTRNKQVSIVELKEGKEITGKVTSIDAPEGTGVIDLLAGWTPENKLGLLMTSEREFSLFTLPAEGGQAAIISTDCYAFQPRWSLDGKQIIYVKPPEEGENRFRKIRLFSVHSGGGTGSPLPEDYPGLTVRQLPYQSGNRISPDGKMIITSAYTYTSADTAGAGEWPNSKIWKISLDGKEAIQITDKEGRYADMCPSWSPDGSKIAFMRAVITDSPNLFEKLSIYTVSSSGGEPVRLIPETDDFIFSTVWSPDGEMIAYLTTIRNQTSQERKEYLNIINVGDGTTRTVCEVPNANVNVELAWSPDSKRIACNGNNIISVVNIADGKTEEIKTGLVDTEIWHLDWSRDGKQFVFAGCKGGNAEFWLMEDFLPHKLK